MALSEAEELELLELEAEAAGYPAPKAKAPSLTQRALKFAREQGPAAVGGMTGAALGAPAGPLGMVGGAMAGGAGGKGLQVLSDYLTGLRDPSRDTSSGVAQEIGLAGLAEGAGEAGFRGLAHYGPQLAKAGAGGLKILAGIPEKYGEAVLRDPKMLNRALPKETVGAGYDAFERYTGLQGLQRKLVSQNRATAPTSELEEMVLEPTNRVVRGARVDPQDLYLASQAASRLKLAARIGEPQAHMAATSGSIGQGKEIAETALEKTFPEYGPLRRQYFEAKAKEAFSPLLPQNKGGTTNVLRPAVALRDMLIRGTAGSATAGLAISPKAWGMLIRLFPALGAAGKGATRLGAAAAADELARPEEELP